MATAELLISTPQDKVIGSSEVFSYYFDPHSIQELKELLSPHFSTIKIISYLRRQDQLAVSHFQESAKPRKKPAVQLYGHSPTALPATSDLQFRYMDYDTRIGAWADVFGDEAMVLRVYDRSLLKNGDVVDDFLDILGVDKTGFVATHDKNVSMGFTQTKIGHILGELVTDQQAKAEVMSRLPSTDKMLPKRADAQKFLEPYLEGNRRLNARFKISDRPMLFSDDFSGYSAEGHETWTEETATEAIRACAKVIQDLTASGSISTEDLIATADALALTHPDLSRKYYQAALNARPNAHRLRAKLDALVSAAEAPTRSPGQDRRQGKRRRADSRTPG